MAPVIMILVELLLQGKIKKTYKMMLEDLKKVADS